MANFAKRRKIFPLPCSAGAANDGTDPAGDAEHRDNAGACGVD